MSKPTKWHVRPAKTPISRPVWPVFAVRMKKPWDLNYQLSASRSLWSDWVDAQADLSLCWAHMPLWFCHEAAQLSWSMTKSAKWLGCPAKTQINLGMCPVWSEFSLGPWRKFGSFAAHEVHSKDCSDWAHTQADLSLCWVHRSFCLICHAADQSLVPHNTGPWI